MQTMSILGNLFKKKKKKPKAKCAISDTLLEYGEGYHLTTSQVVASQKFWDHKMLEPETMSYTTAHFKMNDPMATKMREMIFNKYADEPKPWLICESYINLFDIDKSEAQNQARSWWESGGNVLPPKSGPAKDVMDARNYSLIREYAIINAGADRV